MLNPMMAICYGHSQIGPKRHSRGPGCLSADFVLGINLLEPVLSGHMESVFTLHAVRWEPWGALASSQIPGGYSFAAKGRARGTSIQPQRQHYRPRQPGGWRAIALRGRRVGGRGLPVILRNPGQRGQGTADPVQP